MGKPVTMISERSVMATRIKASPTSHFFADPTNPSAILGALALAPLVGFVLSPAFQVGRFTGMVGGYAIAMGICFAGALLISMNRYGGYKQP